MAPHESQDVNHDTDHIENFGRYCNFFYQSTLSLSSNSLEVDGGSNSHDFKAAKVIVEALDHCAPESVFNQENLDVVKKQEHFLSSPEVKQHSTALISCGLLADHSTSQFLVIPDDVFLKYTQMRDHQRKVSHESQMKQRSERLISLITFYEEKIQDQMKQIEKGDPESMETTKDICQVQAIRRSYLRVIRARLRKFISQHKGNIGCHSFLAGIRALIEKQLSQVDDNTKVVIWDFDGSILSENSFCTTTLAVGNDDREQYMKDALEILLSFAFRAKDQRRRDLSSSHDVESGKKETHDFQQLNSTILSFCLNPYLSDKTLKSMRDEFPPMHKFDARPAGKLSLMVTEENNQDGKTPLCRANADGRLDESIYSEMTQWISSLFTFFISRIYAAQVSLVHK